MAHRIPVCFSDGTPMSMYALDNLAKNAFYQIAIKRKPNTSPNAPHWFDQAPSSFRYPPTEIRIPDHEDMSVSS